MTRAARQEIQKTLITTANDFNFVAISIAIPRPVHAKAIAPLDPKALKKYRSSPYYFLFHGLIGQLMDHRHGAMKKSRIAFFFDRQDEFKGTADFLYHAIKNEPGYSHAQRMGPLTFADKTDPAALPLQLADMVAYETYKFLTEFAANPPTTTRMRWQAQRLFGPPFRKGLFVIKEWNEEGVERLHALHAKLEADSPIAIVPGYEGSKLKP